MTPLVLAKKKTGQDCWCCVEKGHKKRTDEKHKDTQKKGALGTAGHGGSDARGGRGGGAWLGTGKTCIHCKHNGHTEAEGFRKPVPPGDREPKNGDKASTAECILAEVDKSLSGTEERVASTDLCLTGVDRYANKAKYESFVDRYTHDVENK